MSGKSQYTSDDRITVYLALVSNDGNVKRTARDTGFSETTVRRWKKEFDTNPPDREAVVEAVESGDYVDKLRSTRDEALKWLRKKIPDASARDLGTIYGILTDKLARIEQVGSDTEHHHFHHLPPSDEVAELLTGLSQGAISDTRRRQTELEETKLREQPALMPGLRAS